MRVLIYLFVFFCACKDAASLSPPWYTLWNEIRHTIGRDPGVQVDPLDTSAMPYVVNIHVQDPAKARALASILTPRHTIGNIVVDVRVAGASPVAISSSAALADTLRAALETNPLFVSAWASDPLTVKATFSKSIVQFFNDDLGELYGYFNKPAAQVFWDVLIRGNFYVEFGTAGFAIANSASFQHAIAAPNTTLSIMGPEAECASGLHVVANREEAVILYASPALINFVTPAGVADPDHAGVLVRCDATDLQGVLYLNVAEAAPALFTATQNGTGQASIINEDLSYNGAQKPAGRDSVVTVYGTGFGKSRPPGADGTSRLLLPVTATVGGVAAEVTDAMLAPGMSAGVQQIKVRIPPNAPTGPSVPIQLQAGGRSTQAAATIAVS